jgi:glycosyltransferase involved in cell wall biosynthesis
MTIGADHQVPPTGLTAIMPVFNEIELCEDALRRVHGFLATHFPDFEVIIVESGSTDGTTEVCDHLAQELSNVRVIHEVLRNGMGAAMRQGYAHARKPYVFLVTADIPFPLETLSCAVPLLNQHDCVLSFRDEDSRGILRKLQSMIYAWLIKRSLGLRTRCVNSAFKLIPTEFLQSLPLYSTGWFLDAELLYWITQRKLTYAEIPVPLINRTAGKSKVGMTDWLRTIRELVCFLGLIKKTSSTND